MKRNVWVWGIALVLLVPLVSAQLPTGAYWQPAVVAYSWDFSMGSVCTQESQCLLHVQGNPQYDGDMQRWFTSPDAKEWPKCLNDGQSILDYRCENGNWSTRTKHLALQLLQYAESNAPTDFTLFCDSYDRVLNQYQYLVQNVLVEDYLRDSCSVFGKKVPCINNLCVLKTPSTVVIGTTLNTPVDHTQSFLKALEKRTDLCNSVSSSATTFISCGENVWYNPVLQAVVYLPQGSLSSPSTAIASRIATPFQNIASYVASVIHNPAVGARNFVFYNKTRLFNHVYVAQRDQRKIFGFLERDIRSEPDPVPFDYIGVRYTDISLGPDPCLTYIKSYDDRAFCESQIGTGFNVVARHRCPQTEPDCQGASQIVQVWPALTGKLRP